MSEMHNLFMTPPTIEQKLMAYMMGWRSGASGSVVTEKQQQSADFMAGHANGRKDMMEAHELAAKHYGCDLLSPLRKP